MVTGASRNSLQLDFSRNRLGTEVSPTEAVLEHFPGSRVFASPKTYPPITPRLNLFLGIIIVSHVRNSRRACLTTMNKISGYEIRGSGMSLSSKQQLDRKPGNRDKAGNVGLVLFRLSVGGVRPGLVWSEVGDVSSSPLVVE